MLSGFLRQRHVCCLGRTKAPRGLPEVVLDEAQLAIQCRVAAFQHSSRAKEALSKRFKPKIESSQLLGGTRVDLEQ